VIIRSTDDVVRRGAPIIWRGKSVLANDDIVRSQQRIPVSVGARDICKGNGDFDFAAGRGRLDRLGPPVNFVVASTRINPAYRRSIVAFVTVGSIVEVA